jgi:hypothetical protein
MNIKFKKFLAHKMPIYKTNKVINEQNNVNNELNKITNKVENLEIDEEKQPRQVKIKPLKFKF